jgi:hypothetical protein
MSDEERTVGEFLADKQAALKEIKDLQQANINKINALARSGKGVDPTMLANLKIDLIVEMFLDENSKLVYVRNLEIAIREQLDAALAEVRNGLVQKPSTLLIPGRPGVGL